MTLPPAPLPAPPRPGDRVEEAAAAVLAAIRAEPVPERLRELAEALEAALAARHESIKAPTA